MTSTNHCQAPRALTITDIAVRLEKTRGRISLLIINEYGQDDWALLLPELKDTLLALVRLEDAELSKQNYRHGMLIARSRKGRYATLISWIERFRELANQVHVKQYESGPACCLREHERREWESLSPTLAEIINMAKCLCHGGEA
ncbi:hypothetical protein [Methylobacter sp. sgz302048]|uniref:hypothetical protein n=1 Tax=Methylobacter sp. sgz302048 TaxID=3455945 RepID=UPI003FA06EF3